MAKNIVVLMDGTWDNLAAENNGVPAITNVAKFNQYKSLRFKADTSINSIIAQQCMINAVGVWDTVGELGIPLSFCSEIDKALFEFSDNILHQNVLNGYQALAIDEKRADFKPCLWESRAGITQTWFAGVHSDIGGGYVHSGLSNITLHWMINWFLPTADLLIDTQVLANFLPDPFGELHNPCANLPDSMLLQQARIIPDHSLIDQSVKSRIANVELNYNPENLPKNLIWFG